MMLFFYHIIYSHFPLEFLPSDKEPKAFIFHSFPDVSGSCVQLLPLIFSFRPDPAFLFPMLHQNTHIQSLDSLDILDNYVV